MKIVIKQWLVMMGTNIYLNQIKITFVLGRKYNRAFEMVKGVIT
jgi:hypothetical protein